LAIDPFQYKKIYHGVRYETHRDRKCICFFFFVEKVKSAAATYAAFLHTLFPLMSFHSCLSFVLNKVAISDKQILQ